MITRLFDLGVHSDCRMIVFFGCVRMPICLFESITHRVLLRVEPALRGLRLIGFPRSRLLQRMAEARTTSRRTAPDPGLALVRSFPAEKRRRIGPAAFSSGRSRRIYDMQKYMTTIQVTQTGSESRIRQFGNRPILII